MAQSLQYEIVFWIVSAANWYIQIAKMECYQKPQNTVNSG